MLRPGADKPTTPWCNPSHAGKQRVQQRPCDCNDGDPRVPPRATSSATQCAPVVALCTLRGFLLRVSARSSSDAAPPTHRAVQRAWSCRVLRSSGLLPTAVLLQSVDGRRCTGRALRETELFGPSRGRRECAAGWLRKYRLRSGGHMHALIHSLTHSRRGPKKLVRTSGGAGVAGRSVSWIHQLVPRREPYPGMSSLDPTGYGSHLQR
ncbi:hypothetical protein M2275_006809 [Rhodococcus opacus]|nr:hypothetical protein [Rhodococcus opacus]